MNRAIETGELFENEALRGAVRARRERPPARARLARRRPLAHRPPPGAARASRRRRPGSTRSPTVATCRRTRRCTTSPSCPSTASRRWPAATTRWTATSAGIAPSARCARSSTARASMRTIRSPPCRRATTAGITDEFIEPVVIDGRPRLDPERDTAIFFNFRPDRTRQLSEKLGELGVDLTTMTRYRDDFDFPVAFPEHVVENTLAEVLSRARHPPAPLGRDREVRPRHVLPRRRSRGAVRRRGADPRRLSARRAELRPQAGDVCAPRSPIVSSRRSKRTATASSSSTSRTRTWSGHTGVIPAVVQAVETTDACLGRVVDAVERAGGVSLVIADHGNAEHAAAGRRGSPHTAHTTNSVPVILTAPEARLRDGGLSDVAPTVLALLGLDGSSEMVGKNLVQIP